MTFEPNPGTRIKLRNEIVEFTALEAKGPASAFVYAESGKEGTVYRVLKGGEYYAWKVFYPDHQDKRLQKNTENLQRYKEFAGLKVADRIVITPKLYPELLEEYPELKYSVMMPWIQGNLWGNLMLSDGDFKANSFLPIASLLLKVISNLEASGLAHCDLSNNNFIINSNFKSIELIDIEDMYAPDMPRPIPNVSYGTPGYRTPWIAKNGLWGPESDRFATAILCSEILCWQNKQIRENMAGDASYFDEEEIGEKSDRFLLMEDTLLARDQQLSELFKQAWFSEKPKDCPASSEWLSVVEKLGTVVPEKQRELSSVVEKKKALPERAPKDGVASGIPSKMVISHSVVDFGVVQQDKALVKLVIENTGGAVLKGNIETASWIDTSPAHFSIQPGDKRTIVATLKPSRPRPTNGTEYRNPNALVINSDGGTEVVGAIFRIPKPPFYKTWFGIFSMIVVAFVCLAFLFGSAGVALINGGLFSIPSSNTPIPRLVDTNTSTHEYLNPTSTKIINVTRTPTRRPTSTIPPSFTLEALPSVDAVISYKALSGVVPMTLDFHSDKSKLTYSDGNRTNCYEARTCTYSWRLTTQNGNEIATVENSSVFPFVFTVKGNYNLSLTVCVKTKCDTEIVSIEMED